VPVEITDSVRPGVVSIPHGWGHGVDGTRGDVAALHAGANSNFLADEMLLDVPTGTAALNAIPVEVVAAG
jgi:anaerobic selenocysteine-containing dehydrogenase